MAIEYPHALEFARVIVWDWIESIVRPKDLLHGVEESEWEEIVEMMAPAVAAARNRAYRASLQGRSHDESGERLAALFVDLVRTKFAGRHDC